MASGIDTVIFDMDGVIFDSEILVLQAWKEVAERHGIAGVEAACHDQKDNEYTLFNNSLFPLPFN